MVATIPPPTLRNIVPKQNVKELLNGKRAAGTDAQTTGTATSGTAVLTVADASTYLPGHGLAVVGGGAAHGLSAPANCFAIPRFNYQTSPITSNSRSIVPFTVDTGNDGILLPNNVDSRVMFNCPNGEGIRFVTNGAGALPSPLAENTTYFIRHLPQTFTVQMGGTATGGTFRLYSYYARRNNAFHVQEDPSLYVDIPYNADGATFQAAIRNLPGWAQVTASITAGSAPNATYTVTMTGVPNDQLVCYDLANLTGGAPTCVVASTRRGQLQLYDTAPHAIAGGATGLVDITTSGTPTFWCYPYGSKSLYFQAAGLSGNGGTTAAGTECSTSLATDELDEFKHICLVCDKVGEGIVWYGDTQSNKKPITAMDGLTNVRRVALNVSGFTSFKQSDIGKLLSDGTGSATIECFDNTSRFVWVSGSYTFPTNGATLSVLASGTGAGTQSGASVVAMLVCYHGPNFKREYNYYPSFQRRSGEKSYPGHVIEHAGNLFRCLAVREDHKFSEDVVVTVNTSTDVFSMPGTTNFSSLTTGHPVYLRASVALPEISGGRLRETTPYYIRVVSTSPTTFTLHPTSGDASANTNKIDITGAEVGTMYVSDQYPYSSTIGAICWDGGVLLRRENQTWPSTVPGSAIPDIYLGRVISKSGSVLTLSANLTSSVTSMLVLHDDFDAVYEHSTNGLTTNRTLYYPYGRYPYVFRKMGSESRLYNAIYNTLQYYAFRFNSSSHTTWEGEEGTQIVVNSLDYGADLNDDTEKVFCLLNFGYGGFTGRGLEIHLWTLGVPVCERPDAESRYSCWNFDNDGTAGGGQNAGAKFKGPRWYDCGFSGWAQVGAAFWYTDPAFQETYHNVWMMSGGSNHDACLYTNGGSFYNFYYRGIRAENSQPIYQDASRGNWINFDTCYFERARKDGIALRCSEARIVKSKFVDSTKIFARELSKSLVIDDCDLYETDIIPNNGSNAFDDIRITNLRMVDSDITTDVYSKGLIIDNVQMLITARPRKYVGTEVVCTLKAFGQDVNKLIIDNRAWQFDMRSLLCGGTGVNNYGQVKVLRSAVDWCTLQTTGSARMFFDKCEFWSQSGGGQGPILTQHTGDVKFSRCKFALLTGNPLGSAGYLFTSGGRTEFFMCENDSPMTMSNTITGKLYLRNNDWASGLLTISKNDAIIEENNFGTAPSISGTTPFHRGNRISDVASITVGSPFAASINDQALGIADTWIFTLTGNQNATGFVALANGTKKTLINGDGADTATFKHLVTSAAGNQIRTPGGTDFAVAPGGRCTLERANDIWYVY